MTGTSEAELKRYRYLGFAMVGTGSVALLAGVFLAHFAGLPEQTEAGVELYPFVPRGWQVILVGQVIALGGSLIGMAGLTLAYLYKRPMTWARASLGATLFTALMMILFGIIPNEWLTLTQATLEWTPQKIVFTIPPALVLGNEVAISAAAVKDIIAGTYVLVALGAVAVAMYQWQERAEKAATAPPPAPVSTYGRPLIRIED